ncbi:hypothetical protein F0562_034303 [Nyssa sinensis]|uniref:Methyltransferase n=1 Tax=Nyssa sinensis TaxID=561372 RepID=A0A5J5AJD7_9ASTE|nr:hypothetical protein F0562_034303 [Nyssa sinensis]
MTPSVTGLWYFVRRWKVLKAGLELGFGGSGGRFGDFWDLRGGGYLGIGMGGGGGCEGELGSLEGGLEGRVEKRLRPDSVARIAIEEALRLEASSTGVNILPYLSDDNNGDLSAKNLSTNGSSTIGTPSWSVVKTPHSNQICKLPFAKAAGCGHLASLAAVSDKEMDRILRPEGSVIIRDDVDILVKVKRIVDGLNWDSQIVDHEDGALFICADVL